MVRRLPLSALACRFGDLNSLLASAVCHLTMLVTLGLVVAGGHSTSPDDKLAIDLSEGTILPAHDDPIPQDTGQAGDGASDAAAAAGPVRIFDEPGMAVGDFTSIDALAGMATVGSGAEGTDVPEIGVGDGVSGDGGSGGRKKKSGRPDTNFFGVEGYGEKFVYVVDCSGSMSEGHKFERAIYELLQSIEQLKDYQRYFVIFYNHQSYPMNARELVEATPEQFEKTREWISHARPQGGTVPQPALLAALAMKPDAIFFLSDGLFDPSTGRILKMRNRGKAEQIPIHTIAFVNRENEGLMKAIANNSGGDYRYVP